MLSGRSARLTLLKEFLLIESNSAQLFNDELSSDLPTVITPPVLLSTTRLRNSYTTSWFLSRSSATWKGGEGRGGDLEG